MKPIFRASPSYAVTVDALHKDMSDTEHAECLRKIDDFISRAQVAAKGCAEGAALRISIQTRALVQLDGSEDPKKLRVSFWEGAVVVTAENYMDLQPLVYQLLNPSDEELQALAPSRTLRFAAVNPTELFVVTLKWHEGAPGPLMMSKVYLVDRDTLLEDYPWWPKALQQALSFILLGEHPCIPTGVMTEVEPTLDQLTPGSALGLRGPEFAFWVQRA